MRAKERYGDVLVLPAPGDRRLAVACDSLGGIGPKPGDLVPVSGYVVGRFACRVPLMELLALEADPVAVACCLCVEPEPLGREIIDGVRAEIAEAGLASTLAVTGSTEKNVATSQTGVGITVVGLVSTPRWGLARSGDLVGAVGEPRVGGAVSLEDSAVADIPTLKLALHCPSCGDVVPVGSRGIAAEAADLAARSGLVFIEDPGSPLDLQASAGPASTFLVTLPRLGLPELERRLARSGRPFRVVGSLTATGSREGLST